MRRVPRLVEATAARSWRTLLGVAVAAGAIYWLHASGAFDDQSNTLQVMGFDPDRAVLITALVAGAIAAAIVALVGGRFAVAVGTGAVAVLVDFSSVFREETRAALKATGPDGTFDPIGWLLTGATLVAAAVLVGWAATVLARDVRTRLVSAWTSARTLTDADGRRWERVGRLGAVAFAAVVLAVTLPVFGDMLNFDPDAHMRQGAPAPISLFGGDGVSQPGTSPSGSAANGAGPASASPGSPAGTASAAPGPSAAVTAGAGSAAAGSATSAGPSHRSHPVAGPLVVPPDLVAGPVTGSFVSAGVLSTAHPWSTSPARGGGRTLSINLPPPWTGGLTDYATIDIYLPPGYDSGTARYPVIYEPHQPLWAWEQGMHVTSMLNELMGSGAIPDEIVVFVGQYGGPYADSECADSWDGKEWFDRYFGVDVPAWVDAHLRTIASPAARAVLGFSSGGYCAAAAITHHPDVFDTAAIFSGYFVAGIKTTTTPVAGRPFNDDPALEAKVSPINVVPTLPAATRQRLFIAFSADPANHFYGAQITDFAAVLDANGVGVAVLPTPLGHSWGAVREQLPAMLGLIAARQAQLCVFGGS